MATPYKISTITATASANSAIDIKLLYLHCDVNNNTSVIVRAEYIDDDKNPVSRGIERPRKKRVNATTKKRHRFDNQATFLVKPKGYIINTKVFKNGNIQMTGVKAHEDGVACVEAIVDSLKSLCASGISVAETPAQMECVNYRICMINSDFRVPFKIHNNALQTYLNEESDIISIYEPCIYPGVKILFYWNPTKPCADGVCRCVPHCTRKSGTCKKITIAVFQSGSVIITGATTIPMLNDAYAYISTSLLKNCKSFMSREFGHLINLLVGQGL